MSEQSKAAQLKEEGNKFYTQKDYVQAYSKYSEAIAKDQDNAVLYANRAACCIAMKRYQQAMDDSKKATGLDPGYAKAWARLATTYDVLLENKLSLEAWQKALDSLPKDNLTPAELKQKEQYKAGLNAAKTPHLIRHSAIEGRPPWECARAIKPELCERKMEMATSSAWVILNAYEEFIEGVQSMYKLKKTQTPQGPRMEGKLDALAGLTNGIVRDERVFHINKSDWISKYNDQVQFQIQATKAWVDVEPDVVIREAQERLRRQGWNTLRPALSVTVRSWVMRGFVEGGLSGSHSISVKFLGKALEVLDWGSRVWKGVPDEDRGAIFKPTFIRGVRSLHISAFMEAYAENPGPNSEFPLENLLEEADDILREMKANPLPPGGQYDPGFLSSFLIYPAALALSMKGYYHSKMAFLCKPDVEAAIDNFRKAGNFYVEAADKYPQDDEHHAYFLNCGVQCLFRCGTPLRETLPILKRIRLAIPKMKRIWSASAASKQGSDKIFERALLTETELLDAIGKGDFTLDDLAAPEWN